MDKLTALLEEHQYDPNRYCCYCDTAVELYRSSHKAHLAEMLRELLAEVYMEGFTAGFDLAADDIGAWCTLEDNAVVLADYGLTNPYESEYTK